MALRAARVSAALAALRATRLALPPPRTRRCLHASATALAGHSRWAKIGKSKAITDQARGRVMSKHAAALTAAARSGDTQRLHSALDKARRDNVPVAIIERAVSASKGPAAGAAAMEEVVYEGVGPSSVAVLVEALTDNRARAVKWIKAAFRAYGGELQSSGAVSWQFTARGRFTLPCPDASEAAQEALMNAAMEAGADDIEFPEADAEEEEVDGGDGAVAPPPPAVAYVFCDPAVLGTVRNALVAAGHTPSVTEVLRLPQSTVSVPEGDASEAFAAFLARLEELEDVQAVVHNAE